MKKVLIILLFIIFSSNFSLASNNEKITVEDVENAFLNKKEFSLVWKEHWEHYSPLSKDIPENPVIKFKSKAKEKSFYRGMYENYKDREEEKKKNPKFKARDIDRYIAKCMNKYKGKDISNSTSLITDNDKKCFAKIIRVIITRSEKNKKKRPGDIFYALNAMKNLVYSWEKRRKYIKHFIFIEGEDKPEAGMVCGITFEKIKTEGVPKLSKNYKDIYTTNEVQKYCKAFKKNYYKKFEKFKKDPSNEKLLGHKLIKYTKQIRMIRRIEEKIGTNNYFLLGDMLNATVMDVERNNISPDLKIRRALLKKYSLKLRDIKKRLDEDNYKSIDKDVSELSKTYKDLKSLTTTNEMGMNIDEAVDNIFDTNKLIQKSVLNSKDSEEEKLLSLSSIYFMQSLIDSILSTIPEKYYVYTKELPLDLFTESELLELEDIIDTMINKNKEIKSAELTKNMDVINKYINTSDVIKKLDNLGMENSINRMFTHNTATEIINEQIRDNLDKEIFKEVRNIFQEIDRNELSEITKEVSKVASEVASDPSVNESFSILDKKFGNVSVRQLIGACRARGNC